MQAKSSNQHLRSTLTRSLSKLPEVLPPKVGADISTVAQMIVSVDSLIALRASLMDDATALRAVAAGSYFHDNSFLKLLVMDSICGRFRFRLHWWKANNHVTERQNIHNHRFHFYSFVLIGALTNTTWIESADGESFAHYEYHPRLNRDTYLLSKAGISFLNPVNITRQIAGDMYCSSAEILHTSDPDEGKEVVTLFVEDRVSIRPYADVFSNRYTEDKMIISSPALSGEDYMDGLSNLIRLFTLHQPSFQN